MTNPIVVTFIEHDGSVQVLKDEDATDIQGKRLQAQFATQVDAKSDQNNTPTHAIDGEIMSAAGEILAWLLEAELLKKRVDKR
jgi:hypothetical protein